VLQTWNQNSFLSKFLLAHMILVLAHWANFFNFAFYFQDQLQFLFLKIVDLLGEKI
jgi:hypothetical protein